MTTKLKNPKNYISELYTNKYNHIMIRDKLIELIKQAQIDAYNKALDDAIENLNKYTHENCSDHTPYCGACVSCGEMSNYELISEPEDCKQSILKLKK